jgi:hypothetical protein
VCGVPPPPPETARKNTSHSGCAPVVTEASTLTPHSPTQCTQQDCKPCTLMKRTTPLTTQHVPCQNHKPMQHAHHATPICAISYPLYAPSGLYVLGAAVDKHLSGTPPSKSTEPHTVEAVNCNPHLQVHLTLGSLHTAHDPTSHMQHAPYVVLTIGDTSRHTTRSLASCHPARPEHLTVTTQSRRKYMLALIIVLTHGYSHLPLAVTHWLSTGPSWIKYTAHPSKRKSTTHACF